MEEMLEVYCRNTDTKLLVRSGMDMLGVADFAGMKNTENILGVCVNNKVQNLNYPHLFSKDSGVFGHQHHKRKTYVCVFSHVYALSCCERAVSRE